jgi:hypothetical protein
METKIKRNTIDKYTMILNHLKGLSDQNRLTHISEILTQFKASQSIGKQIIKLGWFKTDPERSEYLKCTLSNGNVFSPMHARRLAEACVLYGREHKSHSIGKQIPAKQPEQLEAISPGFDKYTTDEVIQILKNHPEIEIKGPIYIRKEIHL